MDISTIEMLLRAIELGSMSKAAEEYSYTPSALSHIMNSIERELGAKIIQRSYTGIEPIEEYKEIIGKLKEIVDAKNQIIKMVSSKNKSVLRICTYASLSKYILPQIIKGFKKAYPETDINIIVEDKLADAYSNSVADVMFGENINNENTVWVPLITDPYVAVLPESYNFSEEKITRDEMYNNTFIMPNDGKIANYIDERRIKDVINVNSHDDSSVIQMVKEDMGISILPMLSAYYSKGVKCVKLYPQFERVLGLIYNESDIKNKKHLKEFIEYFKTFKF